MNIRAVTSGAAHRSLMSVATHALASACALSAPAALVDAGTAGTSGQRGLQRFGSWRAATPLRLRSPAAPDRMPPGR